MNIQARKLGLIEEFLHINDESLIIKLESVIRQEKKLLHERNLKPMSLNDFHEMIDQAKGIVMPAGLFLTKSSKRG